MQINNSATSIGATLTLTIPGGESPRLQNGQQLTATVIGVGSDGRLTLQLPGQMLEARSPLPLVSGQQLKLLVEIDNNRVLLRLIEPPQPQQEAVSQAWRTALPRQMPLTGVLQALARVLPNLPLPSATAGGAQPAAAPASSPLAAALSATTTLAPTASTSSSPATATAPTAAPAVAADKLPTAAPPLPPKVQQALQQLFEQMPSAARLATPDGLREALRSSGLFLLARLAQGESGAAQNDLQANLLRLTEAVKAEQTNPTAAHGAREGKQPDAEALLRLGNTLQELAHHSEAGLARLKVQQLHTLAGQNAPEPAWLLELPLRHQQETEVLRLRIQREAAARNGNGVPGWSVRLHFDNASHGAIDSVVTLAGSKVGVSFWSEQTATASLFQQRMEELRARLQQAGLEVDQLRSSVGAPPQTNDAAPLPSGLLNISV